ncbi:hypothetical protein [Methylobacterium sp. J-076]|uniref:hypothetical protein n=1 Tax=Methylobacterium sp. J-076 TaxID=2836655 RepID=UPI001FBB2C29|nr:hypothetical protein [Methylobacterium sp. J-076]MCJ2015608.1 hypothetical protein [Methylobacterium sp. J-076]
MPSHACIDPNDPYAQEEVLVAFETIAGVVMLISARDASDVDILPDLEDVQRCALENEIIADYRWVVSPPGRLPASRSVHGPDSQ